MKHNLILVFVVVVGGVASAVAGKQFQLGWAYDPLPSSSYPSSSTPQSSVPPFYDYFSSSSSTPPKYNKDQQSSELFQAKLRFLKTQSDLTEKIIQLLDAQIAQLEVLA